MPHPVRRERPGGRMRRWREHPAAARCAGRANAMQRRPAQADTCARCVPCAGHAYPHADLHATYSPLRSDKLLLLHDIARHPRNPGMPTGIHHLPLAARCLERSVAYDHGSLGFKRAARWKKCGLSGTWQSGAAPVRRCKKIAAFLAAILPVCILDPNGLTARKQGRHRMPPEWGRRGRRGRRQASRNRERERRCRAGCAALRARWPPDAGAHPACRGPSAGGRPKPAPAPGPT